MWICIKIFNCYLLLVRCSTYSRVSPLQHIFCLLKVFDRTRTSDEHGCLQLGDQIFNLFDNSVWPICGRFQERFRQPTGECT